MSARTLITGLFLVSAATLSTAFVLPDFSNQISNNIDIHQRTKRMIVVADQALLEIMTSFKTSMSADVALVGEESMSQLIGALGLIPGFKARSTMSDFKSLVETQGQQLTPVEFQVMTAPIIAAGKSIRLSQMNHIDATFAIKFGEDQMQGIITKVIKLQSEQTADSMEQWLHYRQDWLSPKKPKPIFPMNPDGATPLLTKAGGQCMDYREYLNSNLYNYVVDDNTMQLLHLQGGLRGYFQTWRSLLDAFDALSDDTESGALSPPVQLMVDCLTSPVKHSDVKGVTKL